MNEIKRVLVVDDEEAILLAFRKLLQRPNIIVDTSENLECALKNIMKNAYSLIIADLRLSGTLGQEGFEIISCAKKREPTTKVALVTAYGNPGIREKAIALGADFYFQKPITLKSLNEVMDSIAS